MLRILKKYLILELMMLALILLASCGKEKVPEDSLQAYIDEYPEWSPFNELIACAAGGQVGFLDDPDFPMSMFFYPKPYSTNFRYYETENSDDDPADLSLFVEQDRAGEALFNGFMRRFILPVPEKDVWARVSYVSNDTLWYCKAVRMKYFEKPTLFDPALCEIDLSNPLEPLFNWEDGNSTGNIIYFQVIGDDRSDAISATYTTDQQFQFYNTENVVLNVTRPGPSPVLGLDRDYQFVLMGVSDDNWVNLVLMKNFKTE